MPCVLWGEMFSAKNMTEVGAAGGTLDLGAISIRIAQFLYCTGDGVVKTGPAAAGIEFIFRMKKNRSALAANIGSFAKKLVVFPAERSFGAFMKDHTLFFGCKRFHFVHDFLVLFSECTCDQRMKM